MEGLGRRERNFGGDWEEREGIRGNILAIFGWKEDWGMGFLRRILWDDWCFIVLIDFLGFLIVFWKVLVIE